MRSCHMHYASALLALALAPSAALPAPPLEMAEFDAAPPLALAGDRSLQEAESAAAPKEFSMFSMAKQLFANREHAKAKLTGAEPASTMPKDFAIGYKSMLDWYCKKPENVGKTVCARKSPDSKLFPRKPLMSETIAAFKSFCTDAANKEKAICTLGKVRKAAAGGATSAGSTPSVSGKTVRSQTIGGAKAVGAKKLAKKAAKATAPSS